MNCAPPEPNGDPELLPTETQVRRTRSKSDRKKKESELDRVKRTYKRQTEVENEFWASVLSDCHVLGFDGVSKEFEFRLQLDTSSSPLVYARAKTMKKLRTEVMASEWFQTNRPHAACSV